MKVRKCYLGGKQKALTLSYDDGIIQDIQLTGIMRKYGLKGTFNLNSGLGSEDRWIYKAATVRRIPSQRMAEVYDGQEIAVHSKTHPHLEVLPKRELYAQLYEDRKALEERFGCQVTGMALPFGSWNNEVYQAIKTLGFRYNRTTVSTHDFQVPEDFLLWPATCHHADPELFSLTEAFLETADELALFYLWGHSYEFEGCRSWDVIEAFAGRISGQENVWYASNGEICAYLEDMKRLVAGEDFLLNPTGRVLWVELDGESRALLPGEWVNL